VDYFYYRIVHDPNDKSTQQEQQSSKSDKTEGLLVSCVFISIAFNILFLIIIGFAFKRNRALVRSNRQLLTRDGLHYSRVNDTINIDDQSNTSSDSRSTSPVNSNDINDDDDPMIEL